MLKAAGYKFRQIPSQIEEPPPLEGAPLEQYVLELAILKAKAIAQKHPKAVVIGADTALMLGRHVIGKPSTLAAARRMLAALGGRKHRISSAACIIFPKKTPAGKCRILKAVDTAHVTLRKWTPYRVRIHVKLTRPLSWAGAYAVQDPFSAAIVERIDGDLATVIGLPWAKLEKVFRSQYSE